MVYAITAIVLVFFIVLYAITRTKERDRFAIFISDNDFNEEAKKFVRSIPLPKGSATQNAKKYLRGISFCRLLLKRKKYKGIFDDFLQDENPVQMLEKVDFEKLCDLPSVNNIARATLIASFCLSSDRFVFDGDRVQAAVERHNEFRTLAFLEIMSMKQAFLYVLLEKLYFIYEDLHTIAKVMKIASKYVGDEGLSATNKKYSKYSKSKLFLSLCAIEANYSVSTGLNDIVTVIDKLYSTYVNVLTSIADVLNYDFSKLYSPLEILDKFPIFSNAKEKCKINFLSLLSKLSDKENLDEFMYAIRLEKYVDTASSGHARVKRMVVLGKFFATFSQSEDTSLLGAALRSDLLMNLYFGDNKKSKSIDSISKIIDFENTFEPIYKFSPMNFGISTANGVLHLSPHLPSGVNSADVTFCENGVNYDLHICRGEKREIYLNDTKIEGTSYIRLPKIHARFTVVVE